MDPILLIKDSRLQTEKSKRQLCIMYKDLLPHSEITL